MCIRDRTGTVCMCYTKSILMNYDAMTNGGDPKTNKQRVRQHLYNILSCHLYIHFKCTNIVLLKFIGLFSEIQGSWVYYCPSCQSRWLQSKLQLKQKKYIVIYIIVCLYGNTMYLLSILMLYIFVLQFDCVKHLLLKI